MAGDTSSPEYSAEYKKAEQAALRLIARAEQCSWVLVYKLEKKKFNPQIIKDLIRHLEELDLVNDLRYAQLWLKTRIRNGNKAPHMLNMQLMAKGLDRETVKAALDSALTPEAETALLRSCIVKFDQYKNKNKNKINKNNIKTAIRSFLKMQGFSADAINLYMEEL